MVDAEGELSADFAYVFSVPDAYGAASAAAAAASYTPSLPILPSEPTHPICAMTFHGAYYLWSGTNEDGSHKWARHEEGDATGGLVVGGKPKPPPTASAMFNPPHSSKLCVIRIGGPVAPDAPVVKHPLTGAPVPASECVGVAGGGYSNALKKRYILTGAFHPPTGAAVAYKGFDVTPAPKHTGLGGAGTGAVGSPAASAAAAGKAAARSAAKAAAAAAAAAAGGGVGLPVGAKRPRASDGLEFNAMLAEGRERRAPVPAKSFTAASSASGAGGRGGRGGPGSDTAALFDILDALKKDYNSPDFLQPVDPTALGLPDYFNHVKKVRRRRRGGVVQYCDVELRSRGRGVELTSTFV